MLKFYISFNPATPIWKPQERDPPWWTQLWFSIVWPNLQLFLLFISFLIFSTKTPHFSFFLSCLIYLFSSLVKHTLITSPFRPSFSKLVRQHFNFFLFNHSLLRGFRRRSPFLSVSILFPQYFTKKNITNPKMGFFLCFWCASFIFLVLLDLFVWALDPPLYFVF